MSTSFMLKLMPIRKVLRNEIRDHREKTMNYELITHHFKVKRGFTLIELLIVITIIGILATIVLASFGGVQEKTRDGRRKADLAQMKRAMELAKSDCKGAAYYPYPPGGGYDNLAEYLKSGKYISAKLKDPIDNADHKYVYSKPLPVATPTVCPDTDGNADKEAGVLQYALSTKLERTSDHDGVDSRDICDGAPTPDTTYPSWNDIFWQGYYVACSQ